MKYIVALSFSLKCTFESSLCSSSGPTLEVDIFLKLCYSPFYKKMVFLHLIGNDESEVKASFWGSSVCKIKNISIKL